MTLYKIGLAAALSLMAAGGAYAQGGPPEGGGGEGPPQVQEGGPSGNGGSGGMSGEGAAGPSGEGAGSGMSGEGPGGAPATEERGGAAEGRGSGEAGADTQDRPAAREPREDRDRQAREGGERDRTEKGDARERDSAKRADDRKDRQAEGDRGRKGDGDGKQADTRDKGDDAPNKDAGTKDGDKAASGERKDEAKRVQLSGEKGNRVRDAFRSTKNVEHRKNVDIDISIGTRVPSSWHFYPVPIAVVEVVPEYRDYVFVYVDDRYVICDPDTYEVVAILDAGGGPTYAGGGGGDDCSKSLALSAEDEDVILRSVQIRDEVDVSGVAIGWSVPSSIELLTFPDTVTAEIDDLAGCRYFVADDRIAIVDPEDDKVVLMLERD